MLLWDVADLLRDRKPRPVQLKPEQLDAFWDDLAAEEGDRAYRAVHALTLSGDQAAALLKAKLKPVSGASSMSSSSRTRARLSPIQRKR